MDRSVYIATFEGVPRLGDVNLNTQWVTSGKEYTIISETDKTIFYVDENGQPGVIEKSASIWPWVILAVGGAILLG